MSGRRRKATGGERRREKKGCTGPGQEEVGRARAVAAPWAARFVDGPCADGPERVFSVGPVWGEMTLAPIPRLTDGENQWLIVGGDGVGPIEAPWPSQVTYRLLNVEEAEVVGERGLLAYYEQQP